MPLDNLDPTDNFVQVETKLDAVIDELNDNRFMKWKDIPIGDWDMDSTASVFVAHGLTLSKIRIVAVTIISNDSSSQNDLSRAGVIGRNSTNIILDRTAAGTFDQAAYNSTGFNRGFVTIGYIE